jgi:eukaryotic-like serine/threonine-protein kinase
MLLRPGQKIAEYEVIAPLGAGGMGEVYEVRHAITKRTEALKLITAGLQQSPVILSRLMREIEVLARLDHPNIAALRTAFYYEDRLVMIMEYLEGMTLHKRLQAGSVSIGEAVECIWQLLGALGYAHSQGVVHRDVKPGNVMLTPGLVKLMDFGIASYGDQTLTARGMTLGSVHYMAPEQVQGERAGPQSDIYAVGVVLYECLTGRKPIDAPSDFGVMKAQLDQIPIPPMEESSNVPPDLSAAVMTALAKDPVDRFQTAAEFQEAIEAYRGTAPQLPAMQRQSAGVEIEPWHLDVVEGWVAPTLGAVARPLIQRIAKRTRTLSELREALSRELPSEVERQALRASFQSLESGEAGEPEPEPPDTAARQAMLATQLSRALAKYVGPVASVLVKRAMARSADVEQVCADLAEEIPTAKEREAFLRTVLN